jgi:hypothetical protein
VVLVTVRAISSVVARVTLDAEGEAINMIDMQAARRLRSGHSQVWVRNQAKLAIPE